MSGSARERVGHAVYLDEDPQPYEDWEYLVSVYLCKEDAEKSVKRLLLQYPMGYASIREIRVVLNETVN